MFLEISLPSLNPAPEFTSKPMDDQVAQNDIEITEMKLEQFNSEYEIVNDIEIIEIKIEENSEELFYKIEADAEDGKNLDIANIPVSEDFPKELVVSCSDSEYGTFEYDKLDDEEMAIMVKDLQTTTSGYEHLTNDSSKCSKAPRKDTPRKKYKSRNKLRICHLCGKHYTTDSGFRHHMVMHREPSFSCHICGRVFWESQNLKKHMAAIHSDARPFQCHVCGMNYKRRDVLLEHIKRIHEGVRKKHTNENYLQKSPSHSKIIAPKMKEHFQCPYCNKCMTSKVYLQDHINGVHIKKPLYKCTECDMTFTRKASFRYHYHRAHILKKRILEPRGTFLKDCEYCGLQFQVKKYYDIHVAAKHFNKYTCENCYQVFENKFQLTTHIETAHADEVAKCPICYKTFIEDVHLKRHIYLVHTERKPYECHECGHKANKKSTLAVHMRRHTGEKPYQCEMCIKRFSQSVDFRKHRATHFKQKNEEREAELRKECVVETQEIGITIECIDAKGQIHYETINEVHFA